MISLFDFVLYNINVKNEKRRLIVDNTKGFLGLFIIVMSLISISLFSIGISKGITEAKIHKISSAKNSLIVSRPTIASPKSISKNTGMVFCSSTYPGLILKPAFSMIEERSGAVKTVFSPKKNSQAGKPAKKIRFYPAEEKFARLIYSEEEIDSSVWKPSYGWPTSRQIKWLAVKSWGEFAKDCCEFVGIAGYEDTILSISCRESSASPLAMNNSSGAFGSSQVVFTTAKKLAPDKRIQIPFDEINRACPRQNILMSAVLYKNNMDIFRKKGYDNYRDWAILAHYAGDKNAEDTAAYYGGLYETPFYKAVVAYINIKKPVPAPLWAQKLWADEDWVTIERIRRLTLGKPVQAKKQNIVRVEKKSIPQVSVLD
jgi:hypothetical protein